MQRSGKEGMSDSAVADFVNRFMPAYNLYLPKLHGMATATASTATKMGPQPRRQEGDVQAQALIVNINKQRLPVNVYML